MPAGIDLIDEFKSNLAITYNRDVAANIVLFQRFANQADIGPIIFDQHDVRRGRRRLRFSALASLEG
jgi:hypothetical protein